MSEIIIRTLKVDLTSERELFKPVIDRVLEESESLTKEVTVRVPEEYRHFGLNYILVTQCAVELGCEGDFSDLMRGSNDTVWNFLAQRTNGHIPSLSTNQKKVKVRPASYYNSST